MSEMNTSKEEITVLLRQMNTDKSVVVQELMPLLYDELRELARSKLRHQRENHTLNTTALVHEAYISLVNQKESTWENRIHFLASAAKTMRFILLKYAEKRSALKRGGGRANVAFDEEHSILCDELAEEIQDLDETLKRLAIFDERGAQVVEYRYFGGLKEQEIADVMGISVRTVRRSWFLAKNWIRKEIVGDNI